MKFSIFLTVLNLALLGMKGLKGPGQGLTISPFHFQFISFATFKFRQRFETPCFLILGYRANGQKKIVIIKKVTFMVHVINFSDVLIHNPTHFRNY